MQQVALEIPQGELSMAIGTGNPAGYVPVYDWGAPQIITGYAREAISGGDLVFISGTSDAVSSGANSFVPKTDLLIADSASGLQFTGVAVNNAGSNTPVAVALNGVCIVRSNGTVTGAYQQIVDGANAIHDGSTAGVVCGRALSTATSGGFALFHVGG